MGMKINKNVDIKLKLDVSHYYETMSTLDKAKLCHFCNPASLKVDNHVWEDLWEIYYKKIPVGYFNLGKDSYNRIISVDGIYLLEKYRGKRIVQDVAPILLDYYFKDLGYNKVEASVFDFNTSSLGLCKKYAVREGIRRQAISYQGKFHNKILFGLTHQDFLNKCNK
jgi:RimJ/RimL family protein N-acetyltransferase